MINAGLCAACLASGTVAQTASLARVRVPVALTSGELRNATVLRGPIFRHQVRVPGASWIRLTFDDVVLAGAPEGGRGTVIRMTSLADGAVQTLDAVALGQWRNTSAYFNGEAVSVELIADAGTGPSRLAIPLVMAGLPAGGGIASICGETDDRLPSADPATGRALPPGCTAGLFLADRLCMLAAGHCAGALTKVHEFLWVVRGAGPEFSQGRVEVCDSLHNRKYLEPFEDYLADRVYSLLLVKPR